jgi:hypothetical protein
MSQELKTYDSVGGFSVSNTTLVNEKFDIINANSFEVKNSFFGDASSIHYILRGNTTAVLTLDDVNTQINLDSDTVNFVTGHIIGVNNLGTGYLSEKIESVVRVDTVGAVSEISNLKTIIKDSVPSGETWTVELFDTGAANKFSYSVQKQGGTSGQTIKWVAYVQVISIAWS